MSAPRCRLPIACHARQNLRLPTFSIVVMSFPFAGAAGTPPHILHSNPDVRQRILVGSVFTPVRTSKVEMLDQIRPKALYISSSAFLVPKWRVALYWYWVTSHCQSPCLARFNVATVMRSHFPLPVRLVLAWCCCYFGALVLKWFVASQSCLAASQRRHATVPVVSLFFHLAVSVCGCSPDLGSREVALLVHLSP